MTMNEEIKNQIAQQLTMQTAPFKILSSLRLNRDPIEDAQALNPMFKPRDIYNLKTQLRRESLESLSLIQALIR
jgi:hypothetical protein